MLPFLADLPLSYFIILAFVFGLALGSFLNVIIHRLPLGQSLALPASHCPACQHPLAWRDNIPLVSYLLLRGRCRFCNASISWRYPLVELLTALIWAGLARHSGPTWQALMEMGFALFLIALAGIDAEHRLLPDVLTYPLFLLACLASIAQQLNGLSASPAITYDILFVDPATAFSPQRAALMGGVLLAFAAPCLLLLDWLDDRLFARYFADEPLESELVPTGALGEFTPAEVAVEQANAPLEIQTESRPAQDAARLLAIEEDCTQQRATVILTTMGTGLALALAWVIWMLKNSGADTFTRQQAYEGLTDAAFGAFIAGGVIWFLRAVFFWLRGTEGMGLGDVKMMAGVGAFLGWIPAFAVLLYGSVLGAVVGLILTLRRKQNWHVPLPFGTCLALAALLLLFN